MSNIHKKDTPFNNSRMNILLKWPMSTHSWLCSVFKSCMSNIHKKDTPFNNSRMNILLKWPTSTHSWLCSVFKSCLTLCNSKEPIRLLCPWDFPSKNFGVGCHFLLQGNLPEPGIKPVSLTFGRQILYCWDTYTNL